MKFNLLIVFLLSFTIGCKEEKGCYGDAYPVYVESFTYGIDFVNSTDNHVYFAEDSLKIKKITITDEDKKPLKYFGYSIEKFTQDYEPTAPYCLLELMPFYDEERIEGCKRLLITQDTHVDTLDLCFRKDECNTGFEYLNVKYNNKPLELKGNHFVLKVLK